MAFTLLGISLVLSSTAMAQESSAPPTTPTFVVQQIVIDGKNPLSARETRSVLAAYENRDMTIESLREAATELEKRLALRGYNFYRATLPPQKLVDNTVRMQIARLDIQDVVVTGNDFFSDKNIQRSLPLVARGRSPNTQRIANALLLAEDNPAKDVRVVFVKGDEPQSVDANISVTDKNPNELFFWANNSGSRQTTRSRVGMQYHQRNLWGSDHQVALSYTVSPEETSEINQYGLNYKVPVYTTRGMLNAFYSRSDADTGRVADVFDISGAGETIGVGYTQYIGKRGNYQDRFKVAITDKLFDSDVLFEGTDIGSDVRSRPLTMEYISRFDRDNWLLNTVLSYSTNLSGGSFNDDPAYQAARAGATSNWDKQELSVRFDYRFSQKWRARILGFAQTSSDQLIPGEKFGLGGALGDLGPRGFFEREVTVDEGYKASFEVTRSFLTKRMQLGVFFDIATGDQTNPQVGESPDETLSSIGLAYRWNIRSDLNLEADFGYVLDGVDQEFSDGTDDGDSRIHFALKYFPRWPFGGDK
ncbi:MAG: hypothetical protein KTR35_16775 [Gammaproteobacteria bacterium]|nr:hypothetical protein [Gammaproteobacteria bacterium]